MALEINSLILRVKKALRNRSDGRVRLGDIMIVNMIGLHSRNVVPRFSAHISRCLSIMKQYG